MTTKAAVAASVARRLFVLAMISAAAACGDDTRRNISAPDSVPYAIAIGGSVALRQPGGSSQLTATATFTGGATRDVTREAMWSCTCPVTVATVSAGLATATGFGKGEIVVVYQNLRQSIPLRIAPEGAFLVEGTVTGAGQPMVADVEAASALGTYRVRSDTAGAYVLPGAGAVTLKGSGMGYDTTVSQVMVERDARVDLVMHRTPLDPTKWPETIEGQYTLTFIASPSCTLPADVRQRTYTASIRGGGWLDATHLRLDVALSGARFEVGWGDRPCFVGWASGNEVEFSVTSVGREPDSCSFTEDVGTAYLGFDGTAIGTMSGEVNTTTFDGTVRLDIGRGATECRAANHRLEFRR